MSVDYSYLGKTAQAKYLSYPGCFVQDECVCRSYVNAKILPKDADEFGCVVDENNRFIAGTTLHESISNVRLLKEIDSLEYRARKAIFIGTLYSVFGHAITDCIKKLWFFQTEECSHLLDNGADIVCIEFSNKDLKPYIFTVLKYAGVDADRLQCIHKPVCYEEVFIPDNSIIQDKNDRRFYTTAFKDTVNVIKSNVMDNFSIRRSSFESFKNIYFSRRGLKDWRDYGEDNIVSVVSRAGYREIFPENLSFEEQLILWSEAENIITTEGSISHMAMFSGKDTNIAILRKARFVNGYQMAINHISEANITYFETNLTIPLKKPWERPFFMYPCGSLYRYLQIKDRSFFPLLSFMYYLLGLSKRFLRRWI